MKNIRKIFIVMVALVAVSSCDLNKLDNPSKLSPSQSDPDLLLNQVQVFTASFFYNVSDYSMQMTRSVHFYGPNFENGFTPLSFDGIWTLAYANVLINAKTLIPLADDGTANSKKLYMHVGMAKVLRAYVSMTLVDFFGDVPMSEALDAANLNPKADTGASIYAAAIADLDDAIVQFGKSELKQPQDLFYGGTKASWVTLANTLKLKALMTTRLVDPSAGAKIQALVTANDLIDTDAENFTWKYSTNQANPDSRHPYFSGNYLAGAGTFHTNWLMYNLVYDKTSVNGVVPAGLYDPADPRTRYYWYRQNAQVTNDQNLISCLPRPRPLHYFANTNSASQIVWPFCTLKNPEDTYDLGYWGRDFGDATGVNPDTYTRTNWGMYPVGGKFDDLTLVINPHYNATTAPPGWDKRYRYMADSTKKAALPKAIKATDGLQGAGILPIWMSSFTHFLKAEAYNVGIVTSGGLGEAGELDAGVAASISTVLGFGGGAPSGSLNIPSATAIANYKGIVSARFAAAATPADRLNIIMKEYWIAAFGNGVEVYNNYRRTGLPKNMQPPLSQSPGEYYRSFTYPSIYVNRNKNASQKSSDAVQVFWDNNPPGFVK